MFLRSRLLKALLGPLNNDYAIGFTIATAVYAFFAAAIVSKSIIKSYTYTKARKFTN